MSRREALTLGMASAFVGTDGGWQRRGAAPPRQREALDVKAFGASGDGITDDSGAFTAATNAAVRQGGGDLLIPAGTYVVGEVNLAKDVVFRGAGPAFTTVRTKQTARAAFSGTLLTGGAGVEDLTVDGVDGAAASDGIRLDNCSRCVVRGVRVQKTRGGVGIYVINGRDCLIEAIEITECGNFGVYLSGAPGGTGNVVRHIRGNSQHFRLVAAVNQTRCRFFDIEHRNGQGEALYLGTGCTHNIAVGITVDDTSSGLGDGVAIDRGASYNVLSCLNLYKPNGHGVSASWGSVHNLIANAMIDSPNEGGVIFSDQGQPGHQPSFNRCVNAVVRNASQLHVRMHAGFGISGGVGCSFVSCEAFDDQDTPTMAYGFLEQHGANVAAENSFEGRSEGAVLANVTVLSAAVVRQTAGGRRIVGDFDAGGGYRQTIDGWYEDRLALRRDPVPLKRLASGVGIGSWIAPRPGSITAVSVYGQGLRSSGAVTVHAFKNDVDTGVEVTISDTQTAFNVTTLSKNMVPFEAGDRLDLRFSADRSRSRAGGSIYASLEVET